MDAPFTSSPPKDAHAYTVLGVGEAFRALQAALNCKRSTISGGAFLRSFHIPSDYQERLLIYVTHESEEHEDLAAVHRRLEGRLLRLKEVYVLGDMTKEEYLAERDRLKRELAVLDSRNAAQQGRLDSLARLLGDVAFAWEKAQAAARNRLACALFEEVLVNSKQTVALRP